MENDKKETPCDAAAMSEVQHRFWKYTSQVEPTSDPFHGNIQQANDIRDEIKKIQKEEQAKVQGVKNDQGKERWDLMPFDALREIAKVFTQGAKKYSDRNWENGLDYSRPYSALQRHLSAWWEDREENDAEWGLSHLAHAGCCLLMLLSYQLRNRNKDKSKFDNRPTHNPS